MASNQRKTLIYMNNNYYKESLIFSDLPIEVFDPYRDSTDREEYRTGEILSKCYEMLITLLKEPRNTKVVTEDISVLLAGKTLKEFLNFEIWFSSHMDFEDSLKHIQSFVEFIRVCSNNRTLCTISNLQKFHVMINEPFNHCKSKWLNIYGYSDDSLDEGKIFELLSEETMNEKVIKQLELKIDSCDRGTAERIKYVQKMLYKTRKTQEFKECTNYYEINSIIDLLSACLQEIFSMNKCIALCEHCGRLFIPLHRRDTKYCSFPSPENANRNCKEQVRLENQLKRDNAKESAKMHKSIRTMYANKYGEMSDELNNFLNDSRDKRDLIKAGKLTENEYVTWLKTFFRRKYK